MGLVGQNSAYAYARSAFARSLPLPSPSPEGGEGGRGEARGKGLIAYLKLLETQCDEITDNKDLKLYVFQILSELGSLVFPNRMLFNNSQ